MNVKSHRKILDQPILISKLKNQTPKLLAGAALAYGTYDTFKAPKKSEKTARNQKCCDTEHCCGYFFNQRFWAQDG